MTTTEAYGMKSGARYEMVDGGLAGDPQAMADGAAAMDMASDAVQRVGAALGAAGS